MVIGRVKWFGGFNKKNQTINNYGFIVPLEGEYQKDIYVRRQDVPRHLHDALEAGVYVQVDIDTDNRAINVELMTLIGVVDWFDKGRGSIICEGRPDFRFTSSDSQFNSGDIVQFGIQYNSRKDKDNATFVKLVNEPTEKQKILTKFVQSNNPKIFLKFLVIYAITLPIEKAIELVLEKVVFLDSLGTKYLTNELLNKADNLFLASKHLRDLLLANQASDWCYIRFINKHLKLESSDRHLQQDLLAELIARVRKAKDLEHSLLWEHVDYLRQNLEYHGFLWDIAPLKIKQEVIRSKYYEFFEILSKFNNSSYHYAQYISDDWHQLYQLNEWDEKLIKLWRSSTEANDFNTAKMISARGAENLAIYFHEKLGYKVKDISIHQITKESEDWKWGDIRLDDRHLLDVKNARHSVNSKIYSEFCVPTLKQYRGDEVTIVGVLSPYLQKEYMDGSESPNFPVDNPRVLGYVNETIIKKIKKYFEDNRVGINLSIDLDIKNYLPHWVFDYNDKFYTKQIESADKLKDLEENEIPSWEDISTVEDNPLPLFVWAKREIPQTWKSHFSKWELDFINELINLPRKRKRISLPYLFLALLKHFLFMLSTNDSSYSPEKYLKILYVKGSSAHPLKLYDPLIVNSFKTIRSLCDTLQTLWGHRNKANLNTFRIFKFRGRGLLQGKSSESDSLKTLLAYCGGWIEKKGKCGFNPLIIGEHQTCEECNHLICPKENCGFCSENCSSYRKRKKRL